MQAWVGRWRCIARMVSFGGIRVWKLGKQQGSWVTGPSFLRFKIPALFMDLTGVSGRCNKETVLGVCMETRWGGRVVFNFVSLHTREEIKDVSW